MTDTLYLDIENDGDRMLCVSYALNDGPALVQDEPEHEFWEAVAAPNITKVTQGDHDLLFFLNHKHEVAGPWHNTMVMAWLLDENQLLDLESLTRKYAPHALKTKRITSRANRLYFDERWPLDEYDQWPPAVRFNFEAYSKRDVDTLRDLYRALRKGLTDEGWEDYWQAEEVPYSSLLLRMEARGMPVSLGDTHALAEELRGVRDGHARHLLEVAGLPPVFNLNSPDHLREYLFTRFGSIEDALPMDMDPLPSDMDFEITKVGRTLLHGHWLFKGRGLAPTPPPRKKGQKNEDGKPSTEAKELLFKHGDDPWIQEYVFEYKRPTKLLNTYLDKWPEVAREGRLYTHFKQTGTVTGRLSSADPVNLQNIPKRGDLGDRVRALFQGQLVVGDYDSLEMRLMAHFSQDPKLVDVFARGADPHALTAHAIFGGDYVKGDKEREVGKGINYGSQYGGGARTLAMQLTNGGFPTSQATCKEYLDIMERFYPRLNRWKNSVIWLAKDTGYVETISGRKRRIPKYEQGGGWSRGQYGDRQAVNSVIQGSAADILRRVMLYVDAHFYLPLIAQVHDELIWEYEVEPTPKELELLQQAAEEEHGYNLSVPLVFVPHVVENWSQK